ncbi:MAG TPA: hypothetical protein VK530_01000 [Candidatus Acidoferrum sp.]|nr:hypothetical protein [Candidatus Acidoferrum sp.]
MSTRVTTVVGVLFGVLLIAFSYSIGFKNGRDVTVKAALKPSILAQSTADLVPQRKRVFADLNRDRRPTIDIGKSSSLRGQPDPGSEFLRTDGAEHRGADVINAYRVRWENQLKSSGDARKPAFNPSAVQQVLEH